MAGLLLAGFALLGTAVLSATQWHSAPYIEANQRQFLLDSLSVVIPPGSFDNDLIGDSVELADPPLLGIDGPTPVYRARLGDTVSAVAFRVVAPDGYSGDIELLMGVRADGQISGVRVISHHETPGLGDAIEVRRSAWIKTFTGRSIGDPGDAGWRVKRDGGQFDQFTGATITPRAVVKAIRKGLTFVARHRDVLFFAPRGEQPPTMAGAPTGKQGARLP